MVNNPYIILQARMNSERLPGKVMKQVGDKPLIGILFDRISNPEIPVLLATSINKENDILVEYALERGIKVYRGSEENVLERYFMAAKSVDADLIFRITGDNPFIDANLIINILKLYLENYNQRTYISTGLSKSFPLGISVEAFSYSLLDEAVKNAVQPEDIEHVTIYMHQNRPGDIKVLKFSGDMNKYHYRLTVDTEEDFDLFRCLIENYNCESKSIEEIINILDINPELSKINKDVIQKRWN